MKKVSKQRKRFRRSPVRRVVNKRAVPRLPSAPGQDSDGPSLKANTTPDCDTSAARTASRHKLTFPIGIRGPSAGGLEAVTELLQALPPNPGMAFVVMQHLDPTH